MNTERKEIKKAEGRSLEPTHTRRIYSPRTDIVETNDAILLYAEMPGVDEKAVDVMLEDRVLTIRGEVKVESPKDQNLSYAEFNVGDYERVFALSDEIDRDRIEASVRHGLLRLKLPKATEHRTKKIPVRTD